MVGGKKNLLLMLILACGYGIERKATNYSENKPHVMSFHKNSKASGIFDAGVLFTR